MSLITYPQSKTNGGHSEIRHCAFGNSIGKVTPTQGPLVEQMTGAANFAWHMGCLRRTEKGFYNGGNGASLEIERFLETTE